jgi:glutamate racemase
VLRVPSTVESGAYPRAVAARSQAFEVRARPAPLLVPLVEEGWLDGEVPRLAIERYLTPLLDEQVRVVVLGCTHYPLLKPAIESLVHERLGPDAVVVDSAKATALSVAQALEVRGHLTEQNNAQLSLLVTDLPNSFSASATRFLGASAPAAELVDIVPC